LKHGGARLAHLTDRFPMSPRIKSLRAILDKLDPADPETGAASPLKPPGAPGMFLTKAQRR